MKYLRSIESFKKLKYQEKIITTELQPIKEGFENDITWGGSLIGRLINSTIRVIGVRYKATKIDALIQSFTKALDILLQEVSSISEKKEAKTILAKMLLQEIYKLVMSEEKTVEEKIEALLSVSDYKNRKSATGTPQNDSYKFKKPYKKIFEYAEQAEETEEAESEKVKEIEQGEEGMIDVTIAEVKKCELENKDVLIEKLEKFKSLLMEIDKEAQGQAAQGQAAQGDSKKKYKLYSETRKFLEGYLDIIRQIESNSVKQKSPFKKGDKVMWKKTSGSNKGRLTFGTIVGDIKENDDKIQVKGLDKGNTFPLPIKHALALTFFDEEYYKKMRETNAKDISNKIIKAKIAYYTFMNKKDSSKTSFYENEIDRLEKILPKNTESEYDDLESQDEAQPTATSKPSLPATETSSKPAASTAGSKPTAIPADTTSDKDKGGLVKASFDYYLEDEYLILEEADVRISTKEQIAAWGYIVDVYSDLKKKSDMKKHVEYISGLLKGGSEDKKTITKLGKKIFRLLTSDEYKPIDIEKIKSFTKETSKAVVKVESLKFINEANEAETPPESEETLKGSALICSLARVILSLEQDPNLAKSFVDNNDEGVSKSILKMISSFDGMKKASEENLSPQNSSIFLRSYSDFRLILEADDPDEAGTFDDTTGDEDEDEDEDGDKEQTEPNTETEGTEKTKDNVQIAWFDEANGGKGPFKKGEEKEWVVNIEQIKKPMGPEKEKINIDVPDGDLRDPSLDPIIRIVNIFGKAYSLYATQYIPSGRPEGRVSQRTLREYEYIGKGDGDARGQRGSDFFTPGEGPWAAKRVFEKWEDGVNEVLEDKWYRRVLANVIYVSQAERETGVEQEGKKSGVTLMAFIIEMLTMKGTFKENKRNLLRKYFNIEAKEVPGVPTGNGFPVREGEAEKSDSPVFMKVSEYQQPAKKGTNPDVTGRGKIKKGYFYKAQIEIGGVAKNYILWVALSNDKYILFRAQETKKEAKAEESFVTARFSEPNFPYKTDKLELKYVKEKEVLLIGIKPDQIKIFKQGQKIDLYTITNIEQNFSDTATFQENKGCAIKNLEIMVVSEKTTNNEIQFKPVEKEWIPNPKAQKDFSVSNKVEWIKKQLKT